MKPRNKFLIGLFAALLTFGTLSATVGRHMRHHCGPHSQHRCEQSHQEGCDQHSAAGEEEQQMNQ